MSATEFVQKPVSQLVYHKNPLFLEAITERRPDKVYPKGSRNPGPGDTVEFEIQHDAFVDLRSATLDFKLNFIGASIDVGAHTHISNAADAIARIEVFFADENIERITHVPAWT